MSSRGIVATCSLCVLGLGACAPTGPYEYTHCASDADCLGASRCVLVTWRDGAGGLCTAECGAPSECPHDGRCLDVARSGTFHCFEPCALDVDCPVRWLCQPLSAGGSVCLPGT